MIFNYKIWLLSLANYFIRPIDAKDHWSYQDGPKNWKNISPICNGQNQSPIKIAKNNQNIQKSQFKKILIQYYDKIYDYTIYVNGHTVVFKIDSIKGKDVLISGGPMGESVYRFLQFHFHWGSDNSKGSEHLLFNKRYPLEIHLVHYNLDYLNFNGAINKSNGLTVLALLVSVSDNCELTTFSKLEKVLKKLEKNPSSKIIESLKLKDLFPANFHYNNYLNYNGSLTTPPCSESVNWILFKDPHRHLKICDEQLEILRNIKFHGQESMSNNYRPLQKLGKRIIFDNYRN